MALPGAASLKSDLEGLSPSDNATTAWQAFAAVIGAYSNQVQAGPLGAPGILTFSDALFATQLLALSPVDDSSWASAMADAWEVAMLASVITPGTVSDPSTWLVSIVDVNTLPTAAASIPNLSAAKATLVSGLLAATAEDDPPGPMADAFHAAISSLTFLTVGIGGTPISPVPIPVPRTAQ